MLLNFFRSFGLFSSSHFTRKASQVCQLWSDWTWSSQISFESAILWKREWETNNQRALSTWGALRKCVRLQELNLQHAFPQDLAHNKRPWPAGAGGNPTQKPSSSSSHVDLGALALLTRLNSLNLSGNSGIGDPHLNAIQSLTLLTKLDLSGSSMYHITFPCALKTLGAVLLRLRQLKDLRMAGLIVSADQADLGGSGFCKSVLCQLPKLEIVSLFDAAAGDWLELTALQHLDKVALSRWATASAQTGIPDSIDALVEITETLARVKFGVLLLSRYNVPETLLGRAAARGSLDNLSWMLERKDKVRSYDPNLSDFSGSTPLMGVDNEEAVILLLQAGAEINAVSGSTTIRGQNFTCITALMQAVWDKKFFLTRLLLKSGADIFRGSMLPLKIAALKDYCEIFDEILHFHPDALRKYQLFTEYVLQAIHASRQMSCLLSCLNASPVEWSRDFIKTYRGKWKGFTMLHGAVMIRARVSVIQKLIDIGADVNDLNAAGNSPLRLACIRGDLDTIKVLLKGGRLIPELNFTKYPSCMSVCIRARLHDVYLESLPAYSPSQLTMGPVPIMFDVARCCNWAEFAQFMLHGSSNDKHDEAYSKYTPDYIAEHSLLDLKSHASPTHSVLIGALLRAQRDEESIRILETIIKCGSPIDGLCDSFGAPALMLAMRFGTAAVKLLLDAGCSAEIPHSNINIKFDNTDDCSDFAAEVAKKFQDKLPGHNPVTLAASLLNLPVLELLVKHGANLYAKSIASGKSALHWCLSLQLHCNHAFLPPKLDAKKLLVPVTAFLLQHGLNPDEPSDGGLTAFGFAMQQHIADPQIGQELLKVLFQYSKAPKLLHLNSTPQKFSRDEKQALSTLSLLPVMIEGDFDLDLTRRVLNETPILARLPTRDGRLPITIACRHGARQETKLGLVRLLLENGAFACHLDRRGESGLSAAISTGNHELVELMINFHQTEPRPGFHDSVNILTAPICKTGLNALVFSAQEGHSGTIPVLIGMGFDVNFVGSRLKREYSALEAAVIHNRIECVQVLIKHKADVNIRHRGKYLIQRAMQYGADASILKMLVDAGANPSQLEKGEREQLESLINEQ